MNHDFILLIILWWYKLNYSAYIYLAKVSDTAEAWNKLKEIK